jgi:hypothetical protein
VRAVAAAVAERAPVRSTVRTRDFVNIGPTAHMKSIQKMNSAAKLSGYLGGKGGRARSSTHDATSAWAAAGSLWRAAREMAA